MKARCLFSFTSIAVSVFLLLPACSSVDPAISKSDATLASLQTRAPALSSATLPATTPDAAISSYQQLLRDSQEQRVRAEALRRLADISLRNAELKMLAQADGNESTLSPAQQAASFAEAIRLYRQLLNEYPAYQDKAGVQYQLAKAYDLNAEREASLAALADMAGNSLKHTQYAEAQFRRAEASFVERNWTAAESEYSAVIAQGERSGFFQQSMYKRGWTRFKQSHYEAALDDFYPLLKLLAVQADADKQSQALRGDTYRVLALTFSYLDGSASLAQWYAERGHDALEPEVYRTLANQYLQQERYKDAAETFQGFVDGNPLHPQAPAFASSVITTYEKGNFPSLILPGKERFARDYGKSSAYWMQADTDARAGIEPVLKRHLKDVAQHYHALAQQSRKADDYRFSARWYRDYISSFPQDPQTPALHFLLAEALYDASDLLPAAQEFALVAYRYPVHEKSEAAAYASVLAYQLLYQQAETQARKQAVPIPADARLALRDASIAYVQHFSADAKAANVQVQVMNSWLTEMKLAEAVASASLLLNMPQASTAQRSSAMIVMANGQFDLADYQAAEASYARALVDAGLDAKTQKEFRERRALAIYRQAEAAKTSGDKRAAVVQFLRIAEVEPAADVRANATYDAAALLLELEDWPAAIVVLNGFRGDFSKHPLAAGLTEKLAFAYEQNRQWLAAAAEYETLSRTSTDSALAAEFAWQSVQLSDRSGDAAAAISAWEKYLGRKDADYERSQAGRIRLLALNSAASNLPKQDYWRRELISAYTRHAGAHSAAVIKAVAQSAFELAEAPRQTFVGIALKLPLNKTLKLKREAMQKTLSQYEFVAGLGVGEYVTAAGYRIAQLYQQLAKDLMASERPASLKGDALDEYNVLLEEQAAPFEDKAIALFENNLHLTGDGLYNDWIISSLNALAEMNPARYARTELVPDPAAAMVSPALAQSAEAQASFASGVDAFQKNDAATALSAFDRVLQQVPGEVNAVLNAALALRQQKKNDVALQRLLTGEAGADSAQWTLRGLIEREQGHFSAAQAAYRHALDRDPSNAVAHRNLAILADYYLHDATLALSEFEQYLALRVDDKQAQSWVNELRRRVAAREKP